MILSSTSGAGTNLKRHYDKHIVRDQQQPDIENQKQLGMAAIGNLVNFSYNSIRAQNIFINYLIKKEQPLI